MTSSRNIDTLNVRTFKTGVFRLYTFLKQHSLTTVTSPQFFIDHRLVARGAHYYFQHDYSLIQNATGMKALQKMAGLGLKQWKY